MPVDVPEAEWDKLQIVFATSDGDVRQNDLSDFVNVKRNGKIAMNLPEGVSLVNAAIADENDDIMLVTEAGRAIRFSTTEIRVFKSRGSTGVRGMRLAEGEADFVVVPQDGGRTGMRSRRLGTDREFLVCRPGGVISDWLRCSNRNAAPLMIGVVLRAAAPAAPAPVYVLAKPPGGIEGDSSSAMPGRPPGWYKRFSGSRSRPSSAMRFQSGPSPCVSLNTSPATASSALRSWRLA